MRQKVYTYGMECPQKCKGEFYHGFCTGDQRPLFLQEVRWQACHSRATEHIYVVQSAEGLAKIDKLTPCRYGAPTVLVVAFNKDSVFTYPGSKHSSGAEDAAIVATHLMLAATNAAVDSCWINFFDPEAAAKALGLPENEEVLMLLDLGHAAEDGKPLPNHSSRKALTETVSYL